MRSSKIIREEWKNEQDPETKAILKDELAAAVEAEKSNTKVIEIPADLIDSIVACNPMSGWQPPNEFAPLACQLLSQTKASKRSSPSVDDCRLEFRVNGMTVKTYASNLKQLWLDTGIKEDLFMKGSTDSLRIINPKLKIGYTLDKEAKNQDFKFKMTVAIK